MSTPTQGTTTTLPDSPSPTVKTYANAMDLVRDLNAAGLTCGPPTQVTNPTYAVTLVDCGKQIVVGTYVDHEAALNAYLTLRAELAGTDSAVHMAVGPNWTVSSDDPAYATRVAQLFHVDYYTG